MKVFKQKEREFALRRIPILKEKFPESSHILEFVSIVLEFQNEVIAELSETGTGIDTSGAEARIRSGKPALNLSSVDWSKFLRHFERLLELAENHGTDEIAEGARGLRGGGRESLSLLLSDFTQGKEVSEVERFLTVSFLQPILHTLSEEVGFKQEEWFRNTCPVCGAKPSVSFLMDTEDWEGARFLRCSLCLTDWLYIRTKCVECGNNEDHKLSCFVSPEIEHIEVQACNECGRYIKIVDMRKDGLAVPDLEDIASLSLDIWAGERGLVKVERNLLGF